MWEKNRICVENIIYVRTSFVERWGQNEVGMYVCVVRMKLRSVTQNSCKRSYGVR